MATCPLCGKKGWFLRLGEHGFCKECENEMSMFMLQRVLILDESTNIINSTNNFETALSRIDFQLQLITEIKDFARGKIDPFSLMGLGYQLSYLYDNAIDLSRRAHDFMDSIFQLIRVHIEENGPSPLKELVKIFENQPDIWIEQYDIEKSIKSLLEYHSGTYDISREKVKNKYYYYLDGQEEMIEQLKEGIIYHDSEITDAPPPLKALLKSATPSRQGLYPHEILMLKYAPKFKTSTETFQAFWYWDYSVTDPKAILNSLLDRGFIKAGGLRSNLENLTVPEIKEELKQINQKVSGKKAELIDRLLEFGDTTTLNQKYLEKDCYYSLTPKGKQELAENQYVPFLHKNKRINMTIWEMNRRIALTQRPYRDILWEYFNEQSSIHLRNLNFGLYWCDRWNMYRFLMEDSKNKDDKRQELFHLLCEILLLDLNNLDNNYKSFLELEGPNPESYLVEMYKAKLEDFFPYETTSLTVSSAISDWISEMQSNLGLDDNDCREAILKELQKIRLPRRIFTDEECANIVIATIHNDTNALTAIYQNAEKRQKEKLKEIKSRIK